MRRYEGYIGQTLGGSYRLDALIKVGGMGAVYRASHTRLPRSFAVKILHLDPAANPEIVERFHREAEITASLSHPHIVEVLDFNVAEDGAPFLVMELLEGQDLSQLLRDDPAQPLSFVLELVRQAADALQTAHEFGVIHRDLKPSNLFLCDSTRGGLRLKVLDFGISKLLGAQGQMTNTHAALGTPRYMAPEQASGRAGTVDARTDVFALGTIVYEMLGGVSPFQADSIPGTLYRVVHEDPDPLSAMRPDLPLSLTGAVERAMSKNAEERFASMSELGHAVLTAARDVRSDPDVIVPPSWDAHTIAGPPTPSSHRLRGLQSLAHAPRHQRTAITPVQQHMRPRRPPSSATPIGQAPAPHDELQQAALPQEIGDDAPTRISRNPFGSQPSAPQLDEAQHMPAPTQLGAAPLHGRPTQPRAAPAPHATNAPQMQQTPSAPQLQPAPTVDEPLVPQPGAPVQDPLDGALAPPRGKARLIIALIALIVAGTTLLMVLLLRQPTVDSGSGSGSAMAHGSGSSAAISGSAAASGTPRPGSAVGSAGDSATTSAADAGATAGSGAARPGSGSAHAASGSGSGGGSGSGSGGAAKRDERKLWVLSRPSGARVYLDKRPLGRTPLRGVSIPVGRATLTVRHAGYRLRRIAVDGATTPLELDLKLARVRAAVARKATLRIMTTAGGRPMWASVEVDGKAHGESPVVLKINAGKHRVRVTRKGYRAVTRSISLSPGAARRLVIQLRK